MAKGRLEAQITVPTGGWDLTIDDSGGGGAVTATIPAGEYYISDLIDELEDQLNTAAPTDTITVSCSLGEAGTGKTSITSSGNAAIAWVDTALRDLLGYEANLTLTAAVASVSPNQAQSIWRPDCEYDAPNAILPWTGWTETDGRSVESPGGRLFSLVGRSKKATWLRWHAVARTRASEPNESTVNESFQRFVREGIWGLDVTWGTPGGPFKFYPDASVNSDWVEYGVNLSTFKDFKPEHWADGWAGGPWRCGFERLVVQSSSLDEEVARDDIAVTLLTSGTSTTDGTSVATSSVSPAADAVIYAAVQYAATATTPTCSGNGLTWVEVHTVDCGGTDALTVFRAMGAAPTPGAITFSFGATTQTAFVWSIVQCANVDTTGTNGAGATNQAVEGGPAAGVLTLQAVLAALEHANNVMLVFYGVQGAATCTPDAQFTELMDTSAASPTSGLSTEWALNQTTCDPTFSASTTACYVAVEVKAGLA